MIKYLKYVSIRHKFRGKESVIMDNKNQIRVAHIAGKWVGGGVEAVIMNYYKNIDKSKIQFDIICDSD